MHEKTAKLLLIAVFVSGLPGLVPAMAGAAYARREVGMEPFRQTKVRAPELSGGRSWLNTAAPLTLVGLRGKVVLLDFWTYGCINCVHIIPDLKKLETKYANQLVVIGVHSAKFQNEQETENIRRIILRYGIEHPVVNDADFKIWNAYAVQAWPTQVMIDPAGYVIGSVSGEGHLEDLDQAIGTTVDDFRKQGELKESPVERSLESAKVGDLPLSFPGKILADPAHDRLFIADSNHNRIVITTLAGALVQTVGNGAAGTADGAFDRASFNRPQGLALDGDFLYVADTENHLIRRIDLKHKAVETIAGDRRQNHTYAVEGPGREVSLSSPWDLTILNGILYIAMAGQHQIWKLDLATGRVANFAGSGREGRVDGSLDDAAFAQSSGITNDGRYIYVADSEANIIRRIDPLTDKVETLAGGDLFDFGDVDGTGDDVRLQHPLGVAAAGGKVYIADTYNHRIKVLDPVTGAVQRLAGAGRPGQTDGTDAAFYEPGGLSFGQDKLYVADTNNNAIRVYDLKSRSTSTLMLAGLKPPVLNRTEPSALPNADEITLPEQTVGANRALSLNVNVALPRGYHLNQQAPQRYSLSLVDGGEAIALNNDKPVQSAQIDPTTRFPLRIPLAAKQPGKAELKLQMSLFYCREDNTGTCRIKTLVWRVPLRTAESAAQHEIELKGTLPGE
jgi:DNA-binding beta-propeller fold protein YncE